MDHGCHHGGRRRRVARQTSDACAALTEWLDPRNAGRGSRLTVSRGETMHSQLASPRPLSSTVQRVELGRTAGSEARLPTGPRGIRRVAAVVLLATLGACDSDKATSAT